jgi:selenocysteine lyase/cysteine desulfurase
VSIERSPWRAEFPLADACVFLDHAGVAPISRRVRAAIERFAAEATDDLPLRYPYWCEGAERVRTACARLIGCEARQIAFVKNTSEGLSLVAEGLEWRPGDAVVVADREFPSNVYPWWGLRRLGVEARMVEAGDGPPTIEAIEAALDDRVRVVALSAIGYGTGARLDLARVAELCRSRGAFFVVDGIQALGAVAIDMRRCGFDCIVADGHKWLCAPEGQGVLALSDRLLDSIRPAQLGWKSVVAGNSFYPYDFRLRPDAAKLEPGSTSFLGVLALGAAVDLALEVGVEAIETRIAALAEAFVAGLRRRGRRVFGWGEGEQRSASGILTFVPGGDPERVRQELWARRVVAKVRFGGIRLAPHYYQDAGDVERFFERLDEAEAAL